MDSRNLGGKLLVTREQLKNGKFRYEVDGAVYTKQSGRLYTHASVYVGFKGERVVFLHSRLDLAITGAPDYNRILANKSEYPVEYQMIERLGWTEIVEVVRWNSTMIIKARDLEVGDVLLVFGCRA